MLKIEDKAIWKEILAKTPSIKEIKDQLEQMVPTPTLKDLTIEQYALASARADGYREALNDVFRTMTDTSISPTEILKEIH